MHEKQATAKTSLNAQVSRERRLFQFKGGQKKRGVALLTQLSTLTAKLAANCSFQISDYLLSGKR
jgi:hypothetical protein